MKDRDLEFMGFDPKVHWAEVNREDLSEYKKKPNPELVQKMILQQLQDEQLSATELARAINKSVGCVISNIYHLKLRGHKIQREKKDGRIIFYLSEELESK